MNTKIPDQISTTETHEKTWFEWLAHAFLSEPKNQTELREMLQDASKRDILTQDALDMMEGALEVTEKQVRDIMIPRAQMIALISGSLMNSISSDARRSSEPAK